MLSALVLDETNDCCLKHDDCYDSLDSTKNFCDGAFCACLNVVRDEAQKGASVKEVFGCTALSTSFCDLVRDYGQGAYDAAQQASKQKAGKKL